MDQIILEELEKMIELAIEKGLISSQDFKEIEFNVDVHGRASCIEIWTCSNRRDTDRTVVEIPKKMQREFVFSEAAKHLKNLRFD